MFGTRTKNDNKVGHHDVIMGHSNYTQKSFLYRAVNLYNKLPRDLTLIKQSRLFKKWSKKYNLNNNIKLKKQEDNIIEEENEEDNVIYTEEYQCEDEYNNEEETEEEIHDDDENTDVNNEED